MPKTAKIAISLPEDLLRVVEEERKARGETRSQFFRRAVEVLRQKERQRDAVAQYIEGYRRLPESPEEVEAAYRAAVAVLAEEPWE